MKSEAKVEKTLNYPIEQVWEIFTNRQDYRWRNEVVNFEPTGENTFEETNLNDMVTKYEVLESDPMNYFKIQMNNKIISGIFDIRFEKIDENKTKVTLHQVNDYDNLLTYLTNTFFLSLEKVLNRYIFQVETELKSRNVTRK
ncbi:SRPBCC family protein [Lagierella sp.]|uniref:SRPBCC family protein n=1 Tax=Lagierella sp. TaxID=2849657 RepID=UPI0026047504|nr:SRPBCC family protein [Lagierella sp.]